MFDDIKCDKLRLIYDKGSLDKKHRHVIYNNLQLLFPDCLCSNKAGYILSTFTPTKLAVSKNRAEHNLEMPTENELAQALEIITINNEISKLLWATEIHLTKDVILTQPINDYLLALNELPFRFMKPKLIESNNGEYSLYLAYKRGVEAEGRSKFTIKFYNKSAEYIRRNATPIYMVEEHLTKKEINMLGSAYDNKTKTINLSKVNWLRVEIELHETQKMLPILKELNNTEGKLTANTIIGALREGTFYNTLDTIFSNVLEKFVFSATQDIEEVAEDRNISGVRKLACELLNKSNKYWMYKQIAEEQELQDNFSELATIVRKVASTSHLIQELRDKLCDKEDDENISHSIVACTGENCFSYKVFDIIYKVPIWDDS